MIQNVQSQELVRIAREGTAQQYATALQETGSAVLSNAVETFCQMDRESEDGRRSINELKDLKSSLIAHIERNDSELKANASNLTRESANITAGGTAFKLDSSKTEESTDAVPQLNGRTAAVPFLKKEFGAEVVQIQTPKADPMNGVKKFLQELTGVQGLFTAAVMVPGPLSATVKNVAKELYNSTNSSSGASAGQSSSDGVGLGLLGVGGYSSQSNQVSSFNSQGSAHYEKSTVDERIIPVFTELQDRLSQTTVAPATDAKLVARRDLSEVAGHKTWFGMGGVSYDNRVGSTSAYYGDSRLARDLEKLPYQPEHVRLPDSSISDYAATK